VPLRKERNVKDFEKGLKSAAIWLWNRISGKKFRIFRTIHIVWVGDENKRPNRFIETWRRKNPNWTVRVWGNDELTSLNWINHKHISQMLARRELPGVADMLRWEILAKHGGIAIDADSVCIRPLEDWLFEPSVFACWENEIARPGLIANGFVYSHPGNPLIQQVIDDIHDLPNMDEGQPWTLTGPKRLTDTFRSMPYRDLTIYPSHYFLPSHYTGHSYCGSGPVFANQFWSNTREKIRAERDARNAEKTRSTDPSD
jgi:mannosyltransferase OCH1-like enzyme